MKIDKIILKNIGPYVKETSFDLSVTNSKNIILIGGKNGSGKTTLLKAIRIGLFGSFSLGLKNDSKKYSNELINLLNSDNKNEKFIQIYITITEDLIEYHYCINREWVMINNQIDENVVVLKNNKELNDYDRIQFFEHLKFYTSPQLINSFIFDGEKIGNIIENDETSEFIKKTFESIFSINILNQLEVDLKQYLSKGIDRKLSINEINLNSTISDIDVCKASIKGLTNEALSLNQSITELQAKRKDLYKRFISLGGLTKSQQRKMNEKLILLSRDSDEKQKKIKYFLENDVAFAMNNILLKKLNKQLEYEVPLNYVKSLKNIESYLHVKADDLIKKLEERANNVKSIHEVNEFETTYIQTKIKKINDEYKTILNYYRTKEGNDSEFNLMKNMLSTQSEIEQFKDLLVQLEDIDTSISINHQSLISINKKIDDEKNKFDKLCNRMDILNNEIRKSSTYDNSFILGTKALKVNETFAKSIIIEKLKEISKITLEIFSETIRKDNYITNIEIDSDYNIHLFDIWGDEMKISKLSAGEMQILISAIIWSMFKLSGRKESFVFDTPLARLDVENRITFINKIIKTISDQVIILSTDSEFIGSYLSTINKSIAQKYRLDYQESKKSTKVLKGYFS